MFNHFNFSYSEVSHKTWKALFIMKNILHHINKYTEDCLHIGRCRVSLNVDCKIRKIEQYEIRK